MSGPIEVVPLTNQLVREMAPRVRLEDYMEWMAGCGLAPHEVLTKCEALQYARCALRDGEPLMYWGADEGGNLWMVASTKAQKFQLSLHRALVPEEFNGLIEAAGGPRVAFCWADSRNTVHHRWLAWLGFNEVDERAYGVLGLPFKKFTLGDAQCA